MSERKPSQRISQPKLKTILQRFGAVACLCSVLFVSGFYAFALQSYGWLRMYEAYHQSLPASTALELTFSGEDICGICVLSDESRQDLDDNLELGLSQIKIPLAPLSFELTAVDTPASVDMPTGMRPCPDLQEISIEIEPPPPRLA